MLTIAIEQAQRLGRLAVWSVILTSGLLWSGCSEAEREYFPLPAPAPPAATAPTAPAGLTATAVSNTQIDLSWQASPDAIVYSVLRATSTGGPYSQVGVATGTSLQDTGLAGNTTYSYVVRATNATGTSGDSNVAPARTRTPAPPTTPTNPQATTASDAQIDLSWSESPEAASYVVLRGTTAGGPYSPIGTSVGTSFPDTGLAPNASYSYVVRAVNLAGTSGDSSEVTTTTAPATPAGVTATAASDVRIDLTWSASPGATGYEILRGTAGEAYAQVGTPTGTSFQDTGLAGNTAYLYVVRATSVAGTSRDSAQQVTTTAPIPPHPVSTTAASESRIDLSWPAAPGAAAYVVLRGTASGGPYTQIATPASTSLHDTGLAANTPYYYVVRSSSAAGTSGDSPEAGTLTAPSPPAGLSATVASESRIDLSWSASPGATDYAVLRGPSTGGPYTVVSATASTSLEDSGLSANTTYFYVFQATGGAGTSSNSAELSATTAPAPPAGLSAVATGERQVDLSWTPSTGATSYAVSRATTSGGPYRAIGTASGTTLSDTSTVGGTTYFYVARASSPSGTSSDSSETSATTPISPPIVSRLSPAEAPVGATISLHGTFLSGVTDVSFNGGVQATFTIVSDTKITLAVPVGALGGSIQATRAGKTAPSAEAFVVLETPTVSGLSLPGPTVSDCVPIGYTVSQSQSKLVDVVVEIDPSGLDFALPGPYARATQGSAPAGSEPFGVQGVSTSPSGTAHTFLWNSTADFPRTTAPAVSIRILPVLSGVPGAHASTTAEVANALVPRCDPSFLAASPHATGALPRSLVASDLNGDGKPDLAVANSGSHNVSILLGDGAGRFATAGVVPVGSPQHLAVGDFDGDGDTDLACTHSNWNNVSILPGDGAGGFSAATNVSIASSATGLASGDLDHDGDADLVVSDAWSGTVSVLLGDSGGTFSRTDFAAGAGPQGVAIGDLNGDGNPDVAVADTSSSAIQVLLGDGQGGLSAPSSQSLSGNPSSVAVGDMDEDGHLDLVGTQHSAQVVSVLFGDGAGGFSPATDAPAGRGPSQVKVQDLDNDGHLDLLVTNGPTNTASLLFGTGFGALGSPVAIQVGDTGASEVIAEDLNGDGALDLAAAIYSKSQVMVQLGLGGGAFAGTPSYLAGHQPSALAVGDLSGDGHPDVVASNTATHSVSVLLGSGGVLGPPSSLAVEINPRDVVLGDLNSDGNLDLVIIRTSNVSAYLGTGSGGFGSPISWAANNPKDLAIGDLNADGKADMAVASMSNRVDVILGDGAGAPGSIAGYPVGSSPVSLEIADVNNDGTPDLVVCNSDATVSVLLGLGAGAFGPSTTFAVGSRSETVKVGDLNGDGNLDLVLARSVFNGWAEGGVSVHLGAGDGTFGAETSIAIAETRGSMGLADLDGDGDLDLALTRTWDVVVLHGTGDGTFGAETPFYAGTRPAQLAIADLDSDGTPDLAVANSEGVAVLLGK